MKVVCAKNDEVFLGLSISRHSYFVLHMEAISVAGTTLNLGKLLVNFRESISIFGQDFRNFHWNGADRGTPRQSRPMCSHLSRALPTTQHLFGIQSSLAGNATLYWISFHSSSAQASDSGIPKLSASVGV